MTPKQILSHYRNAIWTDCEKYCQQIKNKNFDKIDALLSYLGHDFNWRHDSRSFRDFLNDEIRDQKAYGLLLGWYVEIEQAEEHENVIYRMTYGVK